MIAGTGKTESCLAAKRGFLPSATFRADGLGIAVLRVTTAKHLLDNFIFYGTIFAYSLISGPMFLKDANKSLFVNVGSRIKG